MQDLKEKCRLALVQASPVMFAKTASLNKALEWIDKAAQQGTELVVFPELSVRYDIWLQSRQS